MAHVVWIIKALYPEGGCWVRVFPRFAWRVQEDAWKVVIQCWNKIVEAGDYVTIDVVKTIRF